MSAHEPTYESDRAAVWAAHMSAYEPAHESNRTAVRAAHRSAVWSTFWSAKYAAH